MKEILEKLREARIHYAHEEVGEYSCDFDVFVIARPASKVEKCEITPEGSLRISTRKRPLEGEANRALQERLAFYFGVSKSAIALISGEKSKQKRFRVSLGMTPSKDKAHFVKKIILFLKEEV